MSFSIKFKNKDGEIKHKDYWIKEDFKFFLTLSPREILEPTESQNDIITFNNNFYFIRRSLKQIFLNKDKEKIFCEVINPSVGKIIIIESKLINREKGYLPINGREYKTTYTPYKNLEDILNKNFENCEFDPIVEYPKNTGIETLEQYIERYNKLVVNVNSNPGVHFRPIDFSKKL